MKIKDLNLKIPKITKIVKFGEHEIRVKQYLPIQDKINIIFNAISLAEDENRFFNPVKLQFQLDLGIVFAYTDLEADDDMTQEEVYNLLDSNGLINLIYINIPKVEVDQINDGAKECAKAIYDYNCSILGVLEAAKESETLTEDQLQQLQGLIKDKDQFNFVRGIADLENSAGLAKAETPAPEIKFAPDKNK